MKEIETKVLADGLTNPGGVQHLVPDGYYTRDQVAKKIGRSRDTLRRWMKSGKFVPRYTMTVGKLKIWLFDDDDVKVLSDLVITTRRGRRSIEELAQEAKTNGG